jgi:hypothetical protein
VCARLQSRPPHDGSLVESDRPLLGEVPAYTLGPRFCPQLHDFVRCCLEPDPSKRWTSAALLQHPYLLMETPAAPATGALVGPRGSVILGQHVRTSLYRRMSDSSTGTGGLRFSVEDDDPESQAAFPFSHLSRARSGSSVVVRSDSPSLSVSSKSWFSDRCVVLCARVAAVTVAAAWVHPCGGPCGCVVACGMSMLLSPVMSRCCSSSPCRGRAMVSDGGAASETEDSSGVFVISERSGSDDTTALVRRGVDRGVGPPLRLAIARRGTLGDTMASGVSLLESDRDPLVLTDGWNLFDPKLEANKKSPSARAADAKKADVRTPQQNAFLQMVKLKSPPSSRNTDMLAAVASRHVDSPGDGGGDGGVGAGAGAGDSFAAYRGDVELTDIDDAAPPHGSGLPDHVSAVPSRLSVSPDRDRERPLIGGVVRLSGTTSSLPDGARSTSDNDDGGDDVHLQAMSDDSSPDASSLSRHSRSTVLRHGRAHDSHAHTVSVSEAVLNVDSANSTMAVVDCGVPVGRDGPGSRPTSRFGNRVYPLTIDPPEVVGFVHGDGPVRGGGDSTASSRGGSRGGGGGGSGAGGGGTTGMRGSSSRTPRDGENSFSADERRSGDSEWVQRPQGDEHGDSDRALSSPGSWRSRVGGTGGGVALKPGAARGSPFKSSPLSGLRSLLRRIGSSKSLPATSPSHAARTVSPTRSRSRRLHAADAAGGGGGGVCECSCHDIHLTDPAHAAASTPARVMHVDTSGGGVRGDNGLVFHSPAGSTATRSSGADSPASSSSSGVARALHRFKGWMSNRGRRGSGSKVTPTGSSCSTPQSSLSANSPAMAMRVSQSSRLPSPQLPSSATSTTMPDARFFDVASQCGRCHCVVSDDEARSRAGSGGSEPTVGSAPAGGGVGGGVGGGGDGGDGRRDHRPLTITTTMPHSRGGGARPSPLRTPPVSDVMTPSAIHVAERGQWTPHVPQSGHHHRHSAQPQPQHPSQSQPQHHHAVQHMAVVEEDPGLASTESQRRMHGRALKLEVSVPSWCPSVCFARYVRCVSRVDSVSPRVGARCVPAATCIESRRAIVMCIGRRVL